MDRFLLQKSAQKPDHWVCTDTVNLIVCIFKEHQFNDTQDVTMLEDFNPRNFMQVARLMREMGDWLAENHSEIIF